MVFEAAKTVSLIESFKTAVPLLDVPEYLGSSKRQVEILYRVGMVKPLVPRTGRGSDWHVVFARQHLDDLLEEICALPELTYEPGENFHSLAYACQRGAGPFEEVFAGIMAGQIPSFRHPEKSGIGAIFIDVDSALEMKMSA